MKKIYLIVSNGYMYEFTDGEKEVINLTIVYHACTTKEDAEKDVEKWKHEEMVENEKSVLEDKMRIYHNYEVMEVNLY